MKSSLFRNLFLVIGVFVVFCVSCSGEKPTATNTPFPSAIPVTNTPKELATPQVLITHAPDPVEAVKAFFDAWKKYDYNNMYSLLASTSRNKIDLATFTSKYKDFSAKTTLKEIKVSNITSITHPQSATVSYHVDYDTNLFNSLPVDNTVDLVMENGEWVINWNETEIYPSLANGNQIIIDYQIPERGRIFDKNGKTIAAPSEVVALGVIPGQIERDFERKLVTRLMSLTGIPVDKIYKKYENAGADWYIPIGETSAELLKKYTDTSKLPGLIMNPFTTRYSYTVDGVYYDGGVAPQVTGYVLAIPRENIDDYRRLGYRGDEQVGMSGLEKWGEQYLAGTHGAKALITDSQGQSVALLGEKELKPAEDVYLTIDMNLQTKIQKSMGNYRGAVVVMERNTGRILSMVSSPGFNPNLFNQNNYNRELLEKVLNNPDQPLVNRAAQSGYPLGSVFKVITMAAALESGAFSPESTYECGYEFKELPNTILYDWTKAKGYNPSGVLTLPQGLIRSCNPWFWHIGLELYKQGRPEFLPEMARKFGLGSVTGIDQIDEITGSIPDAQSEGDATQLAIGQGAMLVTPLQVVRFISAIGNGGTLYRPQIIEKIVNNENKATFTFSPEPTGTLPVSAQNLKIVQDAMHEVIVSKKPRGTAYQELGYVRIPIAGKTSTASTGNEDPHAWFAGYSYYKNETKPNIAVVVLLEDAGEGADFAAPLFRRIVSLYFSDYTDFGGLMPWEEFPYVVSTITPTPTGTPELTETPTP